MTLYPARGVYTPGGPGVLTLVGAVRRYMAYVRTNAGHIGLKYKTRKDKGKNRHLPCKCGKPRHRGPSGKYYSQCIACKSASEKTWAERNPERWARHQLRHRLKVDYGISPEDREDMYTAQDGKCSICADSMLLDGPPCAAKAHVDHNHATGVIRDLLCTRCNWLLGNARESEDILFAAVEYLRVHNGH